MDGWKQSPNGAKTWHRGLRWWEKGPPAKERGQPLGAGKGGEPVVPSSLEKEPSPEDPFQVSALQSGRETLFVWL